MKHLYISLLAVLFCLPLHSQISITQLDVAYAENFDGLGASGTAFVSGWTAVRAGGSGTIGAELTLSVTSGSATSGGVYNVGTTSSSDRALGALASGSTAPAFGASFINSTTSAITSIDFSGVMEQWKSGSSNTQNEKLAFEISFDATSLTTGNWMPVTGLDLLEKLIATTAATAVDGNLAENKTEMAVTVNQLAWSPGTSMWIRWTDNDNGGSDGLYAIDDFKLTPHTSVISGSLTLTNPTSGQTYQTGQTVTFQWTAVDVTTIRFQIMEEGSTVWQNAEGLENIDASLGEYSFTIPTDATGGSMQMRIVNQDNPAVFSAPSGWFTLQDVHFGGIRTGELYPSDNAVDMPTDLLYGYLKLEFSEDVAFSTGNIYLRKSADNSIVHTYNLNSGNWSFAPGDYNVMILQLGDELLPSTGYYITIDAEAIVDRALVPNAFAGIASADAWNFTTGTNNSITTIAKVQTPVGETDASPMVGSKVKVRGVVTFKNNSGFFVQDSDLPYSGIYAYTSSNVVVSDVVEVYGTIKEYNGFTEFDPVEFIRPIGSINTVYQPIAVSGQLTEAYESMLVKIQNVKVSSDGVTSGKEFTVSDLGEPATQTWTIDDWLYPLNTTPALGTSYESITGLVNHNGGAYKLAPRYINDYVSIPTAISDATITSQSVLYVNGTVVVNSSVDVQSVEVVSLSGSSATMNMAAANQGDNEPDGEKGKEIVIPAKSAQLYDPQTLYAERGGTITTRIALKQRLTSGIYVVKVALVNGSSITGKILVR